MSDDLQHQHAGSQQRLKLTCEGELPPISQEETPARSPEQAAQKLRKSRAAFPIEVLLGPLAICLATTIASPNAKTVSVGVMVACTAGLLSAIFAGMLVVFGRTDFAKRAGWVGIAAALLAFGSAMLKLVG